jgi:hypothetical protein
MHSAVFCARPLIYIGCGSGFAEDVGKTVDTRGVAVAVPEEGLKTAQRMDWYVEDET